MASADFLISIRFPHGRHSPKAEVRISQDKACYFPLVRIGSTDMALSEISGLVSSVTIPAIPALYPLPVRFVQGSPPASFRPRLTTTPLLLALGFRFATAPWELASQQHVMPDVRNANLPIGIPRSICVICVICGSSPHWEANRETGLPGCLHKIPRKPHQQHGVTVDLHG
jgi:hypothetical protein